MRLQPIPMVTAGLGGVVVGFISAAFWLPSPLPPPAVSAAASREVNRGLRADDERRSGEVHEPGSGEARRESARSAAATRGEPSDAAAADAEKQARARELGALRARASAAQGELSKARERIARLEKEIEDERSPSPKRTRHEYDLTTEDWKQMAEQATVKYRVPCAAAEWAPTDQNLAQLGLAPEDYDVVRDAFANSAARQHEALLPLCAAALGDRVEVARALNLQSCMALIFSTASERAESARQSARNVATFMAGEGPRPNDEAALTERVFLALAQESRRFEDELASAFGPEEAHRITFSDLLCFSRSSYSYGAEPNERR